MQSPGTRMFSCGPGWGARWQVWAGMPQLTRLFHLSQPSLLSLLLRHFSSAHPHPWLLPDCHMLPAVPEQHCSPLDPGRTAGLPLARLRRPLEEFGLPPSTLCSSLPHGCQLLEKRILAWAQHVSGPQ